MSVRVRPAEASELAAVGALCELHERLGSSRAREPDRSHGDVHLLGCALDDPPAVVASAT